MPKACEGVMTCRVRAFTLFPEIQGMVTYFFAYFYIVERVKTNVSCYFEGVLHLAVQQCV